MELEYVKEGLLFFEGVKKGEINVYAYIKCSDAPTIKTRTEYRLDMLPIISATAWTTDDDGESDQIKDQIDE
jgi:hypothetical protein